MNFRRAARIALLTSGIHGIIRSVQHRHHVILMFHRIRPDGATRCLYDTCPSHAVSCFREILLYVSQRFEIVPLDGIINKAPIGVRRAAITFDDGWRDNYQYAFPILRELNLPASIFITTSKIGTSTPFWQQVLGKLFHSVTRSKNEILESQLRTAFNIPKERPLTPQLYEGVVRFGKTIPDPELRERLNVAGNNVNHWTDRLFLCESEIVEMANHGIEFGSHSVNHPILTTLPNDRVEFELRESRSQLADILGHPIRTVAYPNGSYSREVIDVAHHLGYRIGCGVHRARVTLKDSYLTLPRIEPEWSPNEDRQFDEVEFRWCTR